MDWISVMVRIGIEPGEKIPQWHRQNVRKIEKHASTDAARAGFIFLKLLVT
jgi:hypothetical protein